jgi:hypothetical protein
MNAESSVSSYKKTDRIRGRKPGQTELDTNHKFMQTIGEEMFSELERISREKGIRVQTLLRAVIIPEWAQGQKLSRNPGGDPREIQTAFREKRSSVRARDV